MSSSTTTQMDDEGVVGEEFPPPCRRGDVLADKYVIEELIGMGGMGFVYSARTRRGDVKVAIKLLHPRLLADSEKTERFLREARATARLSSEYIVRVLDVGKRERDGLPYLVMEFLAGEDLGEWLERLGPFPTELAVGFVIQACSALRLAHAAGIVHRDIKPANLILVRQPGGDALLKLLDFGISKAAESEDMHGPGITQTSAVFGSPTYMSPEQVRSAKNVDSRSDVWAIGVVLFELLAGEAPFQGETPGAILAAIVADEPKDLREIRPELPQKLLDIVAACLVKNRDKRMPSVDELAKRLAPFLTEQSDSNHHFGAAIAAVRRTTRMDLAAEPHDAEPPLGRTLRMESPLLLDEAASPWSDAASSNTAVTYSRPPGAIGRRGDTYRNAAALAMGLMFVLLVGIYGMLQLESMLGAARMPSGVSLSAPVIRQRPVPAVVPCVVPAPSAAMPLGSARPKSHDR